ncbi:MAG: zinc ribbon domain-containing protein [Chloroflexota bacterium]
MIDRQKQNLFILLDLDPNGSWDFAVFEKSLKEKQNEWNRLVNHPKRGAAAKENISAIADLKRIASDEDERNEHAKVARKLLDAKQAQELRAFEYQRELYVVKGYMLEEELDALVKKFSAVYSEAEIRQAITVEITKVEKPVSTKTTQPTLEKTTFDTIQRLLQALGKTTLYTFLNMDEPNTASALLAEATHLHDQLNLKAHKTPVDTQNLDLYRHCKTIFASDAERRKYDESRRMEAYDVLRKMVDDMARISKQISTPEIEHLLQTAKQQSLDIEEAQRKIFEQIEKQKYQIVIAESTLNNFRNQQRCGYCSTFNNADETYCNTCGNALTVLCPDCTESVSVSQVACGNCGFPVGNKSWVETLLFDAEAAFQESDLSNAERYLLDARKAWPAPAEDALVMKITSLGDSVQVIQDDKQRIRQLRNQLDVANEQQRFCDAWEAYTALQNEFGLEQTELGLSPQQLLEPIERARGIVAKITRQVKEYDRDFELYKEAIATCRDLPEATRLRTTLSPPPPKSLEANVKGSVVRLQWEHSPSQYQLQYIVVRSHHQPPRSAQDGVQLISTYETTYEDDVLDVGQSAFYAIISQHEVRISATRVLTRQPIMRVEPVYDVIPGIHDGLIRLSWTLPNNADSVVVNRSKIRYPEKVGDGRLIPVNNNTRMIDRDVENGQSYYYSIFCRFKSHNGIDEISPPVKFEGIPEAPPIPITQLNMEILETTPLPRIQLASSKPNKGEAVVLHTQTPLALNHTNTLSQTELAQCGEILKSSRSQYSVTLHEFGQHHFYAVILYKGIAYVGAEQTYYHMVDVTNVQAEDRGDALRLRWTWPPTCQEAGVAYAYDNFPSIGQEIGSQNDSPTEPISVSRLDYERQGFFEIPVPKSKQVDYFISVHAKVTTQTRGLQALGEMPSARAIIHRPSSSTMNAESQQKRLQFFLSLISEIAQSDFSVQQTMIHQKITPYLTAGLGDIFYDVLQTWKSEHEELKTRIDKWQMVMMELIIEQHITYVSQRIESKNSQKNTYDMLCAFLDKVKYEQHLDGSFWHMLITQKLTPLCENEEPLAAQLTLRFIELSLIHQVGYLSEFLSVNSTLNYTPKLNQIRQSFNQRGIHDANILVRASEPFSTHSSLFVHDLVRTAIERDCWSLIEPETIDALNPQNTNGNLKGVADLALRLYQFHEHLSASTRLSLVVLLVVTEQHECAVRLLEQIQLAGVSRFEQIEQTVRLVGQAKTTDFQLIELMTESEILDSRLTRMVRLSMMRR